MSHRATHTHRISDSSVHTLNTHNRVYFSECLFLLHRPDYLWHQREIRASAIFLISSTFSVPLLLFLFQCWLMTRFCGASWLCRHENHASLISYAKPRTSNLGAGVELESKWQQQQLEPTASHSTQPQTNTSRFELNGIIHWKYFMFLFFVVLTAVKRKLSLRICDCWLHFVSKVQYLISSTAQC